MPPLGQRFLADRATLRTELAGIAGVHQHDLPPGPCCLDGTEVRELPQPASKIDLFSPALAAAPFGA